MDTLAQLREFAAVPACCEANAALKTDVINALLDRMLEERDGEHHPTRTRVPPPADP